MAVASVPAVFSLVSTLASVEVVVTLTISPGWALSSGTTETLTLSWISLTVSEICWLVWVVLVESSFEPTWARSLATWLGFFTSSASTCPIAVKADARATANKTDLHFPNKECL